MPVAGNDDGFGLWGRRSQLHDQDDGRSGSNGHNRVHDDAQWAVIRVRLIRMKVRDLSYGQHRQKDQTEQRHSRQKAWPDAAFAAEKCLKSCQSIKPSTPILQKALIILDALGRQECT